MRSIMGVHVPTSGILVSIRERERKKEERKERGKE